MNGHESISTIFHEELLSNELLPFAFGLLGNFKKDRLFSVFFSLTSLFYEFRAIYIYCDLPKVIQWICCTLSNVSINHITSHHIWIAYFKVTFLNFLFQMNKKGSFISWKAKMTHASQYSGYLQSPNSSNKNCLLILRKLWELRFKNAYLSFHFLLLATSPVCSFSNSIPTTSMNTRSDTL